MHVFSGELPSDTKTEKQKEKCDCLIQWPNLVSVQTLHTNVNDCFNQLRMKTQGTYSECMENIYCAETPLYRNAPLIPRGHTVD